MNVLDEMTPESFEKLWRVIRHCEKSPNCNVVRGYDGNDFYVDIRPTRSIATGEELTINFRIVSPADLDGFPELATIVANKLAAYDKAKTAALGPIIEANERLYHANKKLLAENAALEAKLTHTKRTMDALVSKIAAQTGKTVGNTGEVTQRLRDAVRVLQTQSSSGDAGKLAAAPAGSNNFEVTMLTEQLKKFEVSNERLSTELRDLKQQHGALRNQKKH